MKFDFCLSLEPTSVTVTESGFQFVVEISETQFYFTFLNDCLSYFKDPCADVTSSKQ